MRTRSENITPDRPDATIIREAHCMDRTSGHQGFSHISPALIISSANKRGGVIKYGCDNSVSNVKNDNSRPVDHWGVVTADANRVNHLFDRPDFGNYEAGAN